MVGVWGKGEGMLFNQWNQEARTCTRESWTRVLKKAFRPRKARSVCSVLEKTGRAAEGEEGHQI